jgi:hypothetical protein
MQRTADFHEQIVDPRLPKAVGVVDNATALHAAVHVLDAYTPAGNASIRGLLCACEGTPPRLLGRYDHLDLRERKRQKAQILEQPAPCWQWVRRGLGNALIVGAASVGVAEKEDRERRVDQQHVFYRVTLFLTAIRARLLSRILGALDAPFSPIVAKRGEAGAGATVGRSAGAEGPSVGTTRASATPRRCANACTDRLGASPRARSVTRRTTKRT